MFVFQIATEDTDKQAFFRQLSGSCQAFVRQLLGRHQAVVRQLSDSRQAVVRQSSGSRQAFVRHSSGSRQAVIRQSSGSARQSSGSCQAVLRLLSGCAVIWLSLGSRSCGQHQSSLEFLSVSKSYLWSPFKVWVLGCTFKFNYYTQSVLIRNGPIRNTSGIFKFKKPHWSIFSI